MNKLYLFLVLLAIVSCLKRDEEETDDSTEVVSTSTEYLQDYSVEDIRNLIERANDLKEACQSGKLPTDEDTSLAEACDLVKRFVKTVYDLKLLKEQFEIYLPDIMKYIEENGEKLYEICKSGEVSAEDNPDLAQACEALDQYLKSQNAGEEENTQETEVVPVEETE